MQTRQRYGGRVCPLTKTAGFAFSSSHMTTQTEKNSQGTNVEVKHTAGGDSFNMHDASREWATRPADQRFQTLEAITTHCRDRANRSRAMDVMNARVHVEAVGESLVINSEIAPSAPSNWAFGQLASAAGAPAAYLRKLPAVKTADLLNYGLSNLQENERSKFMTIGAPMVGDGWDAPAQLATLQAVTSPTYGRIWDVHVCEAVQRVVDASDGKWHNPLAYGRDGKPVPSGLYASDRDCFLFMIDGGSLLESGPRAQLNRGFFVSNSEVGSRKFRLVTFLFNTCCGNHIIWGARDINELSIRHTSGGPSRFDLEATPLLRQYVERDTADEMAVIRQAQRVMLPQDPDEQRKFGLRFKLTGPEWREAKAYAEREEGQFASVWDLVQGLTAQARDLPFVDARVDLETRAGAILKSLE